MSSFTFTPQQFGSAFAPGSQMQADLMNQYMQDQRQQVFLQNQQQNVFQSAQQLMMNQIFADLEKKRQEREAVKGMIVRIHRAASTLGDYGLSLGGDDTGLGAGKLSDLLKAQQAKKAEIRSQMTLLSGQARNIEKELGMLTDPQGGRITQLRNDFSDVVSNITAESQGLAFSRGRVDSAVSNVERMYGREIANIVRGGYLEGSAALTREYEQEDPATRALIALRLGSGGVDLGLAQNLNMISRDLDINRRTADLDDLAEGRYDPRGKSMGGRALRKIAAGISDIFVDEEDARMALSEGQRPGVADQTRFVVSLVAGDLLNDMQDPEDDRSPKQKQAVTSILNALLTEGMSDRERQRIIADAANMEGIGDPRGYVRDILVASNQILENLGGVNADGTPIVTADSDAVSRQLTAGMIATQARLREAVEFLEQDIILEGEGMAAEDGKPTDVRLKGLDRAEDVLNDMRKRLQTAFTTESQEDLAAAMEGLDPQIASKIEEVLSGIQAAEDRASGITEDREDIALQLSQLTDDFNIESAELGEQQASLRNIRELEGDVAALTAMLGLD